MHVLHKQKCRLAPNENLIVYALLPSFYVEKYLTTLKASSTDFTFIVQSEKSETNTKEIIIYYQ